MPFDQVYTPDGEEAIVRDAIGTHIDVNLQITRGILSIVLEVEGEPTSGPSAEIDIDDLIEALDWLQRPKGV